jgi:hypothetical protein
MNKKLLTEINSSELPLEESFKAYWPTIRRVLRFVKIFTGAQADEVIDRIITWGDNEANYTEA